MSSSSEICEFCDKPLATDLPFYDSNEFCDGTCNECSLCGSEYCDGECEAEEDNDDYCKQCGGYLEGGDFCDDCYGNHLCDDCGGYEDECMCYLSLNLGPISPESGSASEIS
jgi:hypothetical protein